MKKLLILLLVLFSLHRMEAQTITLRNIAPKYYNVKNISYTCDNADFSELFKTELEKRYKVNQQVVKPDAEVKIVAKVVTYTEQTRTEKKIHTELRNQNNQYAGEFHRTIKARYYHGQVLQFQIVIGSEVFPDQKNRYEVPLGSIEDKEPTVRFNTILPGYDEKLIIEKFNLSCPLIFTTTTYNCNDTKLLEAITEDNIGDIIGKPANCFECKGKKNHHVRKYWTTGKHTRYYAY